MKTEPIRIGDVVVREVDYRNLSEEQISELNAFGRVMSAESRPDDPPTPLELTRASVRNLPEILRTRTFWALDPDGSIAAQGQAAWAETPDNRHLVQAELSVRPDRRRRGIAKALLGLLAQVAESEQRPLLISVTSERVAAGGIFAEKIGASPGLSTHINRLVLAEVDRELLGKWVDEGPARAPGYSLVPVDGATPDDMIEAVVDLYTVMNTAPRDDLDVEDFTLTPELVRQMERHAAATGTERWCLYARQDATGELAGYTQVSYNPSKPKTVSQGDTAVRPEHRGHALGKWLKAAMLQRVLAERPDAEDVRTGNADSNDAMLGINRQLGFKPYEASTVWQVQLDKVKAYLGG